MHGPKVSVVHTPTARTARVGDRLLPPEFELRIEPQDTEDLHPAVRASFAVIDGVPQCREVTVTSTEWGREVRRADLREIPLENYLEYAVTGVAMPVRETKDGVTVAVMTADSASMAATMKVLREARRGASGRGPSGDELTQAAEVYRSADRAPTRAVADHFGIAHRTAALWVKRAREAGHLPPAQNGKATR